MAFSATSYTYSIEFVLTGDPSTSYVKLTDTTNWAGLGIDPANVKSGFQIIGPDTLTFKAQSYTDISVGNGNVSINLPLTSTSPVDVQFGFYAITHFVRLEVPEPDAGDYDGAKKQVDLCDDRPTAAFTWTSNCFCTPIMKLEDSTTTTDWTVVSRLLTMSPPANAPANTPYTSAGSTVDSSTDSVYAGLWSAGLTLNLTRNYTTHTVTATITGDSTTAGSTFDLACASSCEVKCCLESQLQRYLSAKCSNPTLAAKEWEKFDKMIGIMFMIQNAEACGDTSNISEWVNEILSIGNCSSTCGDCATAAETGLIEPSCSGSGGALNFFAGSGLQVSVVGSDVTYSLDSSTQAIVSAVRTYTFQSSDGSITITQTITPGTPGNEDYDLSVASSVRAQDSIETRLTVSSNLSGPSAAFSTPVIKGGVFAATISVTLNNAGLGTWATELACVRIDGFYTTPGSQEDYKFITEIQEVDFEKTLSPSMYVGDCQLQAPLDITPFERVAVSATPLHYFDFAFVETNWNYTVTWGTFQSFLDNIVILIRISE